MIVSVINSHHYGKNKLPSNSVYIGRPSKLGNPFSHLKGTLAEFQVANRDTAVQKYEEWILGQLNSNPEVQQEFVKLVERAKTEDISLACYCHPKKCHGDILMKLVNQYLGRTNE